MNAHKTKFLTCLLLENGDRVTRWVTAFDAQAAAEDLFNDSIFGTTAATGCIVFIELGTEYPSSVRFTPSHPARIMAIAT